MKRLFGTVLLLCACSNSHGKDDSPVSEGQDAYQQATDQLCVEAQRCYPNLQEPHACVFPTATGISAYMQLYSEEAECLDPVLRRHPSEAEALLRCKAKDRLRVLECARGCPDGRQFERCEQADEPDCFSLLGDVLTARDFKVLEACEPSSDDE